MRGLAHWRHDGAVNTWALVTAIVTVAVGVSGCAANTTSQTATAPDRAAVRACAITDTGNIDDRTINQSTWEGFQRAQTELGVDISYLISATQAEYVHNLAQSVASGCDVIITVGAMMAEATATTARAHPEVDFVAIDAQVSDPPNNLRPVSFDVGPPSFLAGYLAATTSTTGTVGTWGGIDLPPVRALMEGFRAGVAHYNAGHDASVQVLGWDGTQGVFVDSFADPVAGEVVAASQISQGADVLFPVAGASGLGAGVAIQNSGRGALIWVDTDGYRTTDFGPVIMTSVLKNADRVAFTAIADVAAGTFSGGQVTATLANGGVGLAPFHDFDDDISAAVRAELTTLTDELNAGRVRVSGP